MTTRWADEDVEEDEDIITQIPDAPAPVLASKISFTAFSRPTGGRPKPTTGLSVIVRGLEEGITEGQVARFFASCGSDISIRLAKAKNMAFVEVKSKAAMDKALALDGFKLGRKIVQVSPDLPPKPRRSRPKVEEQEEEEEDSPESSERPRLALLPKSGPAPGFEDVMPPGFEPTPAAEPTKAEKAAARLLRKKEQQSAPKPKAPAKQNRFSGLNDSEDESDDE